MEDWGDSTADADGGKLTHLREIHTHKKDERRFQIHVILVFCGLCVVFLIFDYVETEGSTARDLILTALPVFTFVLGKLDQKNG